MLAHEEHKDFGNKVFLFTAFLLLSLFTMAYVFVLWWNRRNAGVLETDSNEEDYATPSQGDEGWLETSPVTPPTESGGLLEVDSAEYEFLTPPQGIENLSETHSQDFFTTPEQGDEEESSNQEDTNAILQKES